MDDQGIETFERTILSRCLTNWYMEAVSMKKIIILLVCMITVFSLCACGGNIKNVKVVDVESEIYTSAEINAAIEIIKQEFKENWKGCTLREICYAGDETLNDYQDWAGRNDADEVIVLLSVFNVGSSGGDGSLNPNSTYTNWKWILGRNSGEQWKHVDHRY